MVYEDEEAILTIDDERREEAPSRTQKPENKRKAREEPIHDTGKRSSLHSELIFQEMILSIILFRVVKRILSGSRGSFVDSFEARSHIRWSSGV